MHVFIIGATDYISGTLAPRLLERGHTIRSLVRGADEPATLRARHRASPGDVHMKKPAITLTVLATVLLGSNACTTLKDAASAVPDRTVDTGGGGAGGGGGGGGM